MLWNLLRNAVQASSTGGTVCVTLKKVGAEDRRTLEPFREAAAMSKTTEAAQGYYLLRVADDGQGLPAVSAEQLFDAFFTSRSQGTGIGLAVVKNIAEAHQLELSVSSPNGKGAEFSVLLPISER
ncbi:MAG: ATP-binding protein [Polyangiaceae bacterium]|nr:ATP-binding protein [Polyangiaceae bacterium]